MILIKKKKNPAAFTYFSKRNTFFRNNSMAKCYTTQYKLFVYYKNF